MSEISQEANDGLFDRAVIWFWRGAGLLVILGAAESLADGRWPWAFLAWGYSPHSLASQIIEVPTAIVSICFLIVWGVVCLTWLVRKISR